MIRMTAMVSSMVRNLLRAWGAVARADVSNACATSPSVRHDRRFVVAVQMLAAIALTAELGAQGPDRPSDPSRDTQSVQPATAALAQCLAGAAVGLAAHESGHLTFDTI